MNVQVAKYLELRLQQLGVDRIFGVPGNFTAPFLDTILEGGEKATIAVSTNATEQTAGFAADAYARYKGIGVVYTTYGVGTFSAVNAIAGSFTEELPVLIVTGSPTTKQDLRQQHDGILALHSIGNRFADIEVFRQITSVAARVINAKEAPGEIDHVLRTMMENRKPGYLEVAEDVWRAECPPPSAHGVMLHPEPPRIITVSLVDDAVAATIKTIKNRPKVMIWAGAEIHRFGHQSKLVKLIESFNVGNPTPVVGYGTSTASKSVLGETQEFNVGGTLKRCFMGTFKYKEETFSSDFKENGTLLALGSRSTISIVGTNDLDYPGAIMVERDNSKVGDVFYPGVMLGEFMVKLAEALDDLSPEERDCIRGIETPFVPPFEKNGDVLENVLPSSPDLNYDIFLEQINKWLVPEDILVVDAGTCLHHAGQFNIPLQNGFVAQAAWLSIGYAAPAATGVKCANPDKRVIVISGDGAFQENGQSVSDHVTHGQNNVTFVLANGLHGVEQFIVNPNPFRLDPSVYKNDVYNKPFSYNQIGHWDYDKFGEALGAKGLRAKTLDELEICLGEIRKSPDDCFVVHIVIPETNVPCDAQVTIGNPGEDEIPHPEWPPKAVY